MPLKWIVLIIAVIMYVLVVIFPGKKSVSALGAALLTVILGVVSPGEALGELVNWNVLMIFVGSLVIAELFIYSRVPAVIADSIVLHSPNVGIAIVAILMMTGIISAFVENVATVLVMAPIALALCKKLKLDPTYFMVGLAVMANLQGTATLVGDPPSMIFADFAQKLFGGFGFNEFFVFQGKFSIFFAVQIGMIAGAFFFYAYFAKKGGGKVQVEQETSLSMVPSILLILMILGLAAASFVFGGISLVSGLLVVILAIAGLLWFRLIRRESGSKVLEMIKGLDWDTVLFLIGIFVVVGAVAKVGLLNDFSVFLSHVVGNSVFLGFIIILIVSILISGFVDNVPYIIVMLPVAAQMAESLSLQPSLYMFALLIGSCMGGNLTPFGASANIVTVGILKKQGVQLSFSQWLKISVPFTLITVAASAIFVWVVWR
ncbi:putative arsenical pump membrane protein [Treponema primitia ZAS-2]|uniref:Putative arsenical pump membrane protein n=1 Tax=Treponema primitia (strain ATCC BAA-887 / DSM 12427 / ZAS-2) TaxID=545694 RepID=F5YMQ0_TREPZ|nr:SLC13 family permease [Treponema primitia]AEF84241.1 putative arsenical pump membrane protein [Treponema primitia ZAS-2]